MYIVWLHTRNVFQNWLNCTESWYSWTIGQYFQYILVIHTNIHSTFGSIHWYLIKRQFPLMIYYVYPVIKQMKTIHVKATFSFHKLIPKNAQMTTYILIGHCTSLSPWFIILDKINFAKVSNHYLTSGGYQVY